MGEKIAPAIDPHEPPSLARPARSQAIDLSVPDNTAFDKGASHIRIALWYAVGEPLLRARWAPSRTLKAAVLRVFGANIGLGCYIKPGVRVKFPWFLTIGDHCWVGEDAWIDNLAQVTIGSNVCISQGVYLCTGNHDWSTFNMKLFRRPITILDGAWVGAHALLAPGVEIGAGAVVSVGSVVTQPIPSWEIWGGNPAKFLKKRVLQATQVPGIA